MFQEIRHVLGSAAGGGSDGTPPDDSVTSLDMCVGSDTLVAGHASGRVLLWVITNHTDRDLHQCSMLTSDVLLLGVWCSVLAFGAVFSLRRNFAETLLIHCVCAKKRAKLAKIILFAFRKVFATILLPGKLYW